MKVRHKETLLSGTQRVSRVCSCAYSPVTEQGAAVRRLAVACADRTIHLFDALGEWKEKFASKPLAARGQYASYMVTDMAFSPDGTKLAVGQTDNSCFVYRLGADWEDKKGITHKLPFRAPVLQVVWSPIRPDDLFIALADGSIVMRSLSEQKQLLLYQTKTACTHLKMIDNILISAHADGSIHKFVLDEAGGGATHTDLASHGCAFAVVLMLPDVVVAVGVDKRVVIYSLINGTGVRTFDFSTDDRQLSFACGCANSDGSSFVLFSGSRLAVFSKAQKETRRGTRVEWNCDETVQAVGLLPTVAAWDPDGLRMVVGTVDGGLELFETFLRRVRVKGLFLLIYVSPIRVIINWISSGQRLSLSSMQGLALEKVSIVQDHYLVASTARTLILADLEGRILSEINWAGSGSEKFLFSNNTCMIHNAGELTVVELGDYEALGTVRTECIGHTLLSLRLRNFATFSVRRLAYLIDPKTVGVFDLSSGVVLQTVEHDTRVDWLELNLTGDKLLFRDKARRLHVVYLKQTPQGDTETAADEIFTGLQVVSTVHTGQTATEVPSIETGAVPLLDYCIYCQWVPDSNVVVAQSRNLLCVWYTLSSSRNVTTFEVDGEVVGIERGNGKTEVLVEEGEGEQVAYILDEALIEFDAARQTRDYGRAIQLLGDLIVSPEIAGMWDELAKMAMEDNRFEVAERAYMALGDSVGAMSMHRLMTHVKRLTQQLGSEELALEHCSTQSLIRCFSDDIEGAIAQYLNQGLQADAVKFLMSLGMQGQATELAQDLNMPEADQLASEYFQMLTSSGCHEEAAQLKEKQGDFMASVSLYLRAGLPSRAAHLILRHDLQVAAEVQTQVASALVGAGLQIPAGQIYEHFGMYQPALESYIKGESFERAVALCEELSSQDPRYGQQIPRLELAWAEHLMSQWQPAKAFVHFVGAGRIDRAVEAGIESEQYTRAVDLLQRGELDDATTSQFYLLIARRCMEHGELAKAHEYLASAGMYKEIVKMYIEIERFDKAISTAERHLDEDTTAELFITAAQELERRKQYKDAQQLFIRANEPDLAISMWKTVGAYDQMVDLVAKYRSELLQSTHIHLARHLEKEGRLKEAERHFISGGSWKEAIRMYAANSMWHDALHLAKRFEGDELRDYIAFKWAKSVGGEEGARLLVTLGLPQQAVVYCTDEAQWDLGFALAREHVPSALDDLHLKYAQVLEAGEYYREAETQYLAAGCGVEAVQMWIRQGAVEEATRVAEISNDVQAVQALIKAQADIIDEQPSELLTRHEPTPEPEHEPEPEPEADLLFEDQTPALDAFTSALYTFAEQGDWESAFKHASEQGDTSLSEYAFLRSRAYVNEGLTAESVLSVLQLYDRYGFSSATYVLEPITMYVLGSRRAEFDSLSAVASIAYRLSLESSNTRITEAMHLLKQTALAEQESQGELAAWAWTSLLRYIDLVPQDKVFAEAGRAMREIGHLGMAYVFSNRYVDIVEAINEGDESIIDHSDFENSDVPQDAPLPTEHYLSEIERESIASWVLSHTVSSTPEDRQADTFHCANCSAELLAFTITCPFCQHEHEQCCASGYPAVSDVVHCTSCDRPAIRSAWNQYAAVHQACPVCEAPQSCYY